LSDYFVATAGAVDSELLHGRALIYDAALPGLRRVGLLAPSGDDKAIAEPLNNAWFLAVWRYRQQARLLSEYVNAFDTMAEALADLEKRLERKGGDARPYDLIPSTEAFVR
jgi:hypothetical protein